MKEWIGKEICRAESIINTILTTVRVGILSSHLQALSLHGEKENEKGLKRIWRSLA